MKIEFITFKNERYEDYECHEVHVDGKLHMRQSNCIEPEDVQFYRDLSTPFDCESVIKEVIAAVKRGEEIEFIYDEKEDN